MAFCDNSSSERKRVIPGERMGDVAAGLPWPLMLGTGGLGLLGVVVVLRMTRF
jgi:hypothetical protein